MTRTFGENVECPECGHRHTVETAFERWMRNEQLLDSRIAGIARFDCDVLLHRYFLHPDKKGLRDIQSIMFIEVKTFMAEPTDSQRDTLGVLSQFFRNRKTNIHQKKTGRHAKDHTPYAKVWSSFLKKDVAVRAFGGHLLQLSASDPLSSEIIKWDWKPKDRSLTNNELLKLLRFEIDPDTFRPMDWRRRYGDFHSQQIKMKL